MKRWILSMTCVLTLVGIGLTASSTWAGHRLHVTVSFGVGLNTTQPGNAANHKVIPNRITVNRGGVVHFLVSRFHQIFVYNPVTKPEDIVVPQSGTFIVADDADLFYRGIVPAGGPPPGVAGTTNPSNASNRVESVSFKEPGTYLVICAVRGHFIDKMFAFVRVLP